ncbi:hydroxyacid dehydrogenase [uncultured Litoreibacter sp.]|uniref:hydroxyacid dehydrogenase n=1 Tax=uncultured Litoreibacter sp. TaxID=1392394 RepID=UPI002616C9EB|nr:hydroxyacid dehydrogenase [uncultured Litoreibacter sp.]
MKKVVISEFMDEAAVEDLRADHNVVYDPTLVDDGDRLLAELADAEAIIVRNRTQVRGALLGGAPSLRAVGRLGVGLDNIDLDACKAAGISVHPASGANDLSVAEYVITSAAILLRGAYLGFDRMIAGEWPRQDMSGGELSGKTLGLAGFGSIARETASMARALGMTIAAMDPFVPEGDAAWDGVARHEDLASLAAASDVLSLHVPLTDGTRDMVNADILTAMNPGAVVVNAARGGVVDEAALAAALRNGQIAGAALDVFASEPLTKEDGAKFKGLSNLILTPHIAGVTVESNTRVSALTAKNVRSALA